MTKQEKENPMYTRIYPIEIRVYPYGVHIQTAPGIEEKYFMVKNNALVEIDKSMFDVGGKLHQKEQSRCF